MISVRKAMSRKIPVSRASHLNMAIQGGGGIFMRPGELLYNCCGGVFPFMHKSVTARKASVKKPEGMLA
jgi:hypothetical protein